MRLGPGEHRLSSGVEWAGAIVVVVQGSVDVVCLTGNRQRFAAGEMVCLDWLQLHSLANPCATPARLVAVRRRRA